MNKNKEELNLCKDKRRHNLRSLIEQQGLLKCSVCKKIFTIVKEKQTEKIRIEEVRIY